MAIIQPTRTQFLNADGTVRIEWTRYFNAVVAAATQILSGTGSPETIVTAVVGTLYLRTDGGVGTTLYVKESGTGNVGWVAK